MTAHSKITLKGLVDSLTKKSPSEELTIGDIVKGEYMPWAKHHRTVLKLINTDSENKNILKVKRTENGYYIQSRNLIRYIKKYGPALMGMVRQSNDSKKNSSKRRSKIRKN